MSTTERLYEILFIADPNLGEAEFEELVGQVQGFVEKAGGVIDKTDKWGKKRMAYMVGKHREGSYVLMTVQGGGGLVREIGRRLKVTDGVIRHLVVRVDEELRKAQRRKERRAAEENKRRARMQARAARQEAEGGVQ